MTGRVRYLVAAAFVALYWLIPAPEGPGDRHYLALLQVRGWLMDGSDSPLRTVVQGGRIGPLEVDLVSSPPVTDPGRRAGLAQPYERSAAQWARARRAEGEDIAFSAGAPPVRLEVRIGREGTRATAWTAAGDRIGGPREWDHPDRTSLVPAFLAIVLAILTGKIIPALLLGCLAGAFLFAGVPGGLTHFAGDTLWQDVLGELRLMSDDGFNLRVTAFVVFLFMAVGIMARSGGIQGMVHWVSRFARGPVSTQVCTWIIGLLIFFDDYSNCIISGTTMRPLTDRNRISREKLSYIVDSTAAPIAGISIFSTWVAYEVSQFRSQLPEVTRPDGTPYVLGDGFAVFVQTLPYRFYCIFTILAVVLTILLRREWGPMLAAERRARHEGKAVADDAQPMVSRSMADLKAPEGKPIRGANAFVPIVVLVLLTIGLIVWLGLPADAAQREAYAAADGVMERLQWIMGHSASEKALMFASLAALVLAAVMALAQRILSLQQVLASALRSAHSLVFAIIILLLAWSIGTTCGDLGTNFFLTAGFGDVMDATVLPIVLFLLAGLVAFSTGTSYGTMAILLPNVVVLSHTIGSQSELGGPALMVLTIGAVLEGSIFGDHCSPISDTTVLSSVGTGSDHLHHVQTQAPYAVLTMAVAVLCGYLPMVLLGVEWWPLAWAAGFGVLVVFLLTVGRSPSTR